METDAALIVALMLAALAAGYIDAIAGGGGLITVPALLMAGLSPVQAIATNKLQGTIGVATSTHTYWRAGHLDMTTAAPVMVAAGLGAAAGALAVSILTSALLAAIMPWLLLSAAAYFACAPWLRTMPRRGPPIGERAFTLLVAAPVGFYDGFFGPGTGALYMLGSLALRARALLAATAETKAANLASNMAALMIFIGAGHVAYSYALPMMAGQIAGAWLGARMAIRNGERIIRPLLVMVATATAIGLMVAE